MRKSLKKQLAVRVIEKDFLAGIPPTGHMINRTGKLQSERPCHARAGISPVCSIARPQLDSHLERKTSLPLMARRNLLPI
jgi:hypothetical protein